MKRLATALIVLLLVSSPVWAKSSHRKLFRISPRAQATESVIVRFRSEEAMERLLRTKRNLRRSLQKKYHRFPFAAAYLSGKQAAELAKHPDVLSIEGNSVFQLHRLSHFGSELRKLTKGRRYDVFAGPDDSWGVEPTHEYENYGLAMMGVTKAFHQAGNRGQGAKVGIIDTGIDTTHPDLFVTGGWNFCYNDSNAYGDVLGHGTHVAGIIAASDNGYGIIGMAPDAQIYSLRAFDIFGNGNLEAILNCIQWAIDYKLDILNMSWGSTFKSLAIEEALQRASGAGILLIASAGNEGGRSNSDTVTYPAKFDFVVAVSAVDENGEIADFSSRGPDVEVAAPGVDILSTFTFPPHYEHFYDLLNGTSMACPHVVGLAALIMSANPGISSEEVRTRLSAFANDLGADGWDPLYGWGLPQTERNPQTLSDGAAPTADPGGPYRGVKGKPVQFSAAGTLDGDDNFLTYQWEFGDGSFGEGRYPRHAYAQAGEYSVTLTVADQDGLSRSANTTVDVRAGVERVLHIPAADSGFVRSPDTVYLGRNVLAGKSLGRALYGVMLFNPPELDNANDLFVLKAELRLTGDKRGTPADEGTITVALLPADAANAWPGISYASVRDAAVRPLKDPIHLSYLHRRVGDGLKNRFTFPEDQIGQLQEELWSSNGNDLAFRLAFDTPERSDTMGWSNPILVLHYMEDTSSDDTAPVADAGYDRRALAGARVVLDGSQSYDPDGEAGSLSFTWEQLSGSSVGLAPAPDNPAVATFTAPSADDVLVFELEVEDGVHISTDQVTIYLNDYPAELIELVIVPGFGKAGFVAEDHPELNFFDKRVMLSGVLSRWETDETTTLHGQSIHIGAMQFDLSAVPPGSQVTSAKLELTGIKNRPDLRTSYDIKILADTVDESWDQLNFERLRDAEAIATLSPTLTPYMLDEGKVNTLRVAPQYLESRRASTDKITFRIDGPTFLWRTVWEWFGWWSGNEEATAELGPRLVVEYGAVEPIEVPLPGENHPPLPEVVSGTQYGSVGEPYEFTFTATDPDDHLVRLEIDWGDGSIQQVPLGPPGRGVNLSHAWSVSGTYAIAVLAVDQMGASASVETQIEISETAPPTNSPPVLEISTEPFFGSPEETYAFEVSAMDPDGNEVRFLVNWGDGSDEEITGYYPSGSVVELFHAWREEGEFVVTISAEDTPGAFVSSQFDVVIQGLGGEEVVISDAPNGTWYLGTTYSRSRQAQTFKAVSSQINGVSVALTRTGTPQPIQVTIRRSLDYGVLATAEIDPSRVESTDQDNPSWVTVPFDTPAEVREGSYYFLCLEVPIPDSANYYRVGYNYTDPYPFGNWYPDRSSYRYGNRDVDMVCSITFAR